MTENIFVELMLYVLTSTLIYSVYLDTRTKGTWRIKDLYIGDIIIGIFCLPAFIIYLFALLCRIKIK